VPTLDAGGSGRWLVLIGWLWLAWHLFVRSSVPGLRRRGDLLERSPRSICGGGRSGCHRFRRDLRRSRRQAL